MIVHLRKLPYNKTNVAAGCLTAACGSQVKELWTAWDPREVKCKACIKTQAFQERMVKIAQEGTLRFYAKNGEVCVQVGLLGERESREALAKMKIVG
jgi:hypothetical protein